MNPWGLMEQNNLQFQLPMMFNRYKISPSLHGIQLETRLRLKHKFVLTLQLKWNTIVTAEFYIRFFANLQKKINILGCVH